SKNSPTWGTTSAYACAGIAQITHSTLLTTNVTKPASLRPRRCDATSHAAVSVATIAGHCNQSIIGARLQGACHAAVVGRGWTAAPTPLEPRVGAAVQPRPHPVSARPSRRDPPDPTRHPCRRATPTLLRSHERCRPPALRPSRAPALPSR